MYFAVHCTRRGSFTEYYKLKVKDLVKSPSFKFTEEDPSQYLVQEAEIFPRERKFPNEPLPAYLPSEDPAPAPSKRPPAKRSKLTLSIQDITQMSKDDFTRLRDTVYGGMDLLVDMGFDVMKAYSRNRRQAVLEAILPNEVTCPECDKKLANTPSLKKHYRGVHMQATELFCTICEMAFTKASSLKTHMRRHNPKAKMYFCNHITTVVGDDGTPSQVVCDFQDVEASKVRQYRQVHEDGIKCQFCGKPYSVKRNYTAHQKNPNKVTDKVDCLYCAKNLTRKSDANRHIKTAHKGRPTIS